LVHWQERSVRKSAHYKGRASAIKTKCHASGRCIERGAGVGIDLGTLPFNIAHLKEHINAMINKVNMPLFSDV